MAVLGITLDCIRYVLNVLGRKKEIVSKLCNKYTTLMGEQSLLSNNQKYSIEHISVIYKLFRTHFYYV